MIKVDSIYGNDISDEFTINHYDVTLKTLTNAIQISKTGDTIELMPGTYEPFELKSSTSHFELSIIGKGNNTICSQSLFDGFFDFSYEKLKIETTNIKSSSSNFNFKEVNFVSMNTMHLESYHDNKSEDPRTHLIFDRCTFGHNFQIIVENGSYVISLKSCIIKGRLPLIFAKRGDVTIKISNTDFEHSILMNKNAVAEIQHISCNFNCPIYSGKETLVYTKDGIMNTPPLLFSERCRSTSSIVDVVENDCEITKSNDIEYQKEFYGAIMIDSNDYEELAVHKFTTLVVNSGLVPLKIKLPKEANNGHILNIFSEGKIMIGPNVYEDKHIKLAWIYSYGWWVFPKT